jgi:hypothetical protein
MAFVLYAPQGRHDLARGFNPGNNPKMRRALQGRQIERTNKSEVESKCGTFQLL